jgi:hypothetical protein
MDHHWRSPNWRRTCYQGGLGASCGAHGEMIGLLDEETFAAVKEKLRVRGTAERVSSMNWPLPEIEIERIERDGKETRNGFKIEC